MPFSHGHGRLSQEVNVKIVSQEALILGCTVRTKWVAKDRSPEGMLGVKIQKAVRKPDKSSRGMFEQNCSVSTKMTWICHCTLSTVP